MQCELEVSEMQVAVCNTALREHKERLQVQQQTLAERETTQAEGERALVASEKEVEERNKKVWDREERRGKCLAIKSDKEELEWTSLQEELHQARVEVDEMIFIRDGWVEVGEWEGCRDELLREIEE